VAERAHRDRHPLRGDRSARLVEGESPLGAPQLGRLQRAAVPRQAARGDAAPDGGWCALSTTYRSASGLPQWVKGRNRYHDSPLRGGAFPIASQLWKASIAARAEPCITVGAAESSSAVEHEVRCSAGGGDRQPSLCVGSMRNAVLREVPSQNAHRLAAPPCTSAIRALLDFSIAHHPAHNFLVKRLCCRFAQVIGITSDPRTTFPLLLKIPASTIELCALPAGSDRRRPHYLARRSIAHHQRRHPDQTGVEPAAS
jgi:hypothetical protein